MHSEVESMFEQLLKAVDFCQETFVGSTNLNFNSQLNLILIWLEIELNPPFEVWQLSFITKRSLWKYPNSLEFCLLPQIFNLFCRFHCRTAINKCYRLLGMHCTLKLFRLFRELKFVHLLFLTLFDWWLFVQRKWVFMLWKSSLWLCLMFMALEK